jgi:Zn-dependent metalloprotease
MKKILLSISALLVFANVNKAQTAQRVINKSVQSIYDNNGHLSLATFNENDAFPVASSQMVLNDLMNSDTYSFKSISKETDALGFTHEKFSVFYNNVQVNDAVIIIHSKAGLIRSINGDLSAIELPYNSVTLTPKAAIQKSLTHLKVKSLKADNKAEETHMRQVLNQPNFSYAPKSELVIYKTEETNRYAYKVAVYAETPLFNGFVFIDAENGNVLGQQSLICTIDVPATANTKYSGTQSFINDQFAGGYRLRETQRGQGIETYNLNNASNYGNATDFVNASTTWTSTGVDQAATDAHWGSEKTYDYFQLVHNRNSIDNNGFKLLSYVHYNTNYNNAFWDGQRMTYGDGNGSTFTILTALDVCGHEITHGLVQKTAGLNGGGTSEADALNEAFADIFGTSIERYARPSNWNWKIGSDMTPNGNGIRNMQNPGLLNDPDTYLGTSWDNSGEPHNNAGPAIYWFYLLCQGGSGTNDLSNAFNVTGLGNVDAEKIAFRALTVYFTPGTTYNLARTYCIQAAKDLFGNCSTQAEQTGNAWYAVGVGGPYSNAVIAPNFNALITSVCNLPATINFNNTTSNALTYNWSFGDGNVSSTINPSHTYTANGTYQVKLVANGCNFAKDSIIKNSYITINAPNAPTITVNNACLNASAQISANGNALIQWYNNPSATGTPLATGPNFSSPTLTANTTYYAINTLTSAPVFGGITSNTMQGTSGGFLSNAAQWLVFDVLQACTLKSVVVYAQTAGVRSIQIKNGLGAIVSTTTVNLTAGANTVVINFPLPAGPNNQIGLTTGSTAGLFRTNSGVAYPYNIASCVNIKTSSAGTGFYYWFYNWEIQKNACSSGIIPVNVTANPNPNVTLSVPSPTVCVADQAVQLNGLPSGGTYSGSGVSGSSFNPSVGIGTYNLNYAYTDNNGCSSNAQTSLVVEACAGIFENQSISGIKLYPNPATQHCVIENNLGKQLHLIVFDALGKIIDQQQSNSHLITLPLAELNKGIYTVRIQESATATMHMKLIKQ